MTWLLFAFSGPVLWARLDAFGQVSRRAILQAQQRRGAADLHRPRRPAAAAHPLSLVQAIGSTTTLFVFIFGIG
jgi:hypothetical protein